MMKIHDFEDIFDHIGGFGRFQYSLFAASCLINVFLALVYYGQIFMTLTPPHWCRPPPEVLSLNLTSEDVKRLTIPLAKDLSGFESCARYDADFMEAVMSNRSWPDPSWPVKKCDYGWAYDFTDYYPTITSELDWVCDEDWRPPLAQSLYFVGSMIGCPLFGWAADVWGRLPVIVLTNMIGAVAGMASAFAHSFGTFAAFRFIVGLTYEQHYTIAFILLLEYVGKEYRTIMANVPVLIFLTAGSCAMPWVAWALADWTYFTIAIHAPQLLCLIFLCVVPESARWLVSRGRVDETVAIIQRAAAVNNKPLSQEATQDFRAYCEKQAAISKEEGKASVLDLLKTPVLRKRFLVLCLMWIVLTIAYDGHMRNSENIGHSIFISFTIASAVELPADLLMMVLTDWLGRRHTTVLSLVLSGIISLAVGLVPEDFTISIMVLAFTGRFLITMAMNVGHQYQVEVLPTVARAQGMGTMQTLAFLAAFSSPYIVYLNKYGYFLPYLIMGILTIVGGTFCLLLPETLDENLPNSIAEGETFFTDQSLCYNPFARKKSPKDDIEDGIHGERKSQTSAIAEKEL